MLQPNTERNRPHIRALPGAQLPARSPFDTERETITAIMESLRRNLRLIALATLIGTASVAAIVSFGLTPQYRATTTILVDSRKTHLLKDQEIIGRPGTDNSAIESEAEMLASPAILRKVAESLELDKDPEFMGSTSIIGWVKWLLLSPFTAIFGGDNPAPSAERLDLAAEMLRSKVSARRRNLTYVIELSAWSRDGAKAAELANKIASFYLAEQVGAKNDATRQATEWLNLEVEQIRARLAASERAYEEYKAEAGLFNSNGQNLTDRQIAQLNEQLVMARAKTAEAEAKYEQLRQINADKLRSAAASPDVLESAVLSNLRNQYAEYTRQRAELTTRYGPRHPQVINVQAQLTNLTKQIREELDRIVGSARTEHEMAKSRQASLSASLDELKHGATEINQKAVKLRELEREAQANRALFEAFLARAKEAAAQLNLQMPDSRILSAATPPLGPSYPRKGLMVGLGLFGSLGLGIFLALLRGMLSEGFRRPSELASAFGFKTLATIPLVAPGAAKPGRRADTVPLRTVSAKLAKLVPDNSIAEARRLAELVVREPDSPFSESIHSLRFALRQIMSERRLCSLLITSALPGEGKSTVTSNLARAAALSGERVLLIDADLRRPCMAALFGLPSTPGLVSVLKGKCAFQDAVLQDPRTGLHIMAGASRIGGAEALTLLASRDIARLMAELHKLYDFILIDSSPLLPVPDPRFLVDQVDGAALVVACEQTSRSAVKAALEETPALEGKLLGAVMNRVVENFARNYPEYGSFHKVA